MPAYTLRTDALEQKVAELEANGEKITCVTVLNEDYCVVVTWADGRRRPRGVETR